MTDHDKKTLELAEAYRIVADRLYIAYHVVLVAEPHTKEWRAARDEYMHTQLMVEQAKIMLLTHIRP